MSQQTATQDLAQGLSSDLKLTNIVALATMTAAMIVILLAEMTQFYGLKVLDDNVIIAFVGGTAGVLIVYIGAQAATGGAYVNAVASLSGVNVVAGATPPATPSTNTPSTQVIGVNLAKLGTAFAALTPAQIQVMTPAQLTAFIAAAIA